MTVWDDLQKLAEEYIATVGEQELDLSGYHTTERELTADELMAFLQWAKVRLARNTGG
jgi:hypothetical protein